MTTNRRPVVWFDDSDHTGHLLTLADWMAPLIARIRDPLLRDLMVVTMPTSTLIAVCREIERVLAIKASRELFERLGVGHGN